MIRQFLMKKNIFLSIDREKIRPPLAEAHKEVNNIFGKTGVSESHAGFSVAASGSGLESGMRIFPT